MADVVVVGAGIIGCAIARELAVRGLVATVVDPRPPGGGATQASAGMLAPYIEAHDRGPLLDLGVRSLDLYDEWIAKVRHESGLDVEYRRIGTLEVALDPDHASELHRTSLHSPDPARRWMTPDEARQARPALGGLIAGALFTPSHGYVSAHQLTHALARAAEHAGARFRQATVQTIAPSRASLTVHTSDGDLSAATVVLAAGAWTNQIAIPAAAVPPLRPIRGQLLHLGWQAQPIDTILWGPECYIVPRLDGTLLVGATVEDVGFDERTTAAGVRDLLDAACDLLPAGWGATFLGARAGLRPATPDDLPAIGPDPRLPGSSTRPDTTATACCSRRSPRQLIADWIVEKKNDPALEVLRPGRFENVRST